MGPNKIELAALHRQAEEKGFTLDQLPWDQGVDASRHFAPESLGHIYHSPCYQLFDAEERRLHARVVGFALAEMFIFFEDYLLIPAIERFKARRAGRQSTELQACLTDFISEEHKHTEMFWRLLEAADPVAYQARRPLVYGAQGLKSGILQATMRLPSIFICWLWLAILFEERTVSLYRQYQADPHAEPLFAAVHRFHMLDEIRHVAIDQHLLAEVWDPAPLWLRRLNVVVLARIMAMFTAPRISPMIAVDYVLARSPRLQPHRAEFVRDVAALGKNVAFQQAHYSREALPRTFALLDRYPEMAALQAALPLYRPEPA